MSLASDVYGSNPTRKRVQRMIGSAPAVGSFVPVGHTAPPVAASIITQVAPTPLREGYCYRVGQSYQFVRCDCSCHFAEPG